MDEGPTDAPPLLLVHGNPPGRTSGGTSSATCRARGHRCVALDHMGFGRSDKPPHLSAYSLRAHIDNTLALLDELDLRDVILVAHDWGGPIGLGAMLERADRLRGIVLMNTWAWELPSFVPPFVREFRTEGLGEILALGGNLFVESIPGGMERRDTDPVMMDAYRAPFPDYWSRVGPLAFQREIPLTERDRSAHLISSIHEGCCNSTCPPCSSGECATACSSRCSWTSGARCCPRPRRWSSTTPGTTWWRTAPRRSPKPSTASPGVSEPTR